MVNQILNFYLTIPFFITLMMSIVIVKIFDLRLSQKFYDILERRAFPTTSIEVKKMALIRLCFGLILLYRAYHIIILLSFDDYLNIFLLTSAIANFAAAVFLIAGIFTQYSLIYLVFIHWWFGDSILGTGTLANDIGAILAVILFITNSGRFLSVDNVLIRICKENKYFLAAMLYFPSMVNKKTIINAKVCALFSYSLVCVYSLAMHLNESAWMTGNAGPLLLSSNYMSYYNNFFLYIFSNYDWTVYLSRISIWIMMGWYALIFPFVLLGGYYRKYVIIWGVLFFALSVVELNIVDLGYIEFLLWAALFWSNRGIKRTSSYQVAFDDQCNLCDRTVQFIRCADVFDRIKLLPLSNNKNWVKAHNLTTEQVMKDLHGYNTITLKKYHGYSFYEQLTREVVLLWLFYPVLLFGRWLKIGPAIYKWIALRRRRLFGVCHLPSVKKKYFRRNIGYYGGGQELISTAVLLHILLLGTAYFISIPAPYIGYSGYRSLLSNVAHIYGIAPINVFNRTDLRMNEIWFTLSLVKKDNTEELLPIFKRSGERLDYHKSHRIYFGNTLQFRRRYLRGDLTQCKIRWGRNRMNYLSKVYLKDTNHKAGKYQFIYRQYYQKNPDDRLLSKNKFVPSKSRLVCSVKYALNYIKPSDFNLRYANMLPKFLISRYE